MRELIRGSAGREAQRRKHIGDARLAPEVVEKFVAARPDLQETEQGSLAASNGSVTFGAGGRILATASATNPSSVILRDLTDPNTPRRIGDALDQHSPVDDIAFSGDGRTLAVGEIIDGACLWDTTQATEGLDRVLERACRVTVGGLDDAEWNRFVEGVCRADPCAG